MYFRNPPTVFVLVMVVGGIALAQVPSARAILDAPEKDQVQFVSEAVEAGFPDDRADQLTMLVLNRSALVLPMLEQRIETELLSQSPSKSFIETASEMIGYAGDVQSLLAVRKLMQIDETRFGRLVARTLDNALTFRNPFAVAYVGIEIGDGTISGKIGAWADTALRSRRMQRLLAEAMVERYGRVPDDSDWKTDQLTVLLKSDDGVREAILAAAKEVRARRN